MKDKSTQLIHHGYQAPAGFAAPAPAVHKASTVFFSNCRELRERDWLDKQAYTYGLAGGTNTPQQFADGRGVLAIHAVADPATLGRDAPTGAIGLDRGVLERLYENVGLPVGTPVTITE